MSSTDRRRQKGRTIPFREATPRETDIAFLDRDWFDRHPGETTFTRPAHPYELRTLGLPPGTICRVVKIDSYRQARMFAPPQPAEVTRS